MTNDGAKPFLKSMLLCILHRSMFIYTPYKVSIDSSNGSAPNGDKPFLEYPTNMVLEVLSGKPILLKLQIKLTKD